MRHEPQKVSQNLENPELGKERKIMNKKEIEEKRTELKRKVSYLIGKYQVPYTLEQILEIIENEKTGKELNYLIGFFARAENIDQINEDIALITETWNYFPHKGLDGLSPVEKLEEYKKQNVRPKDLTPEKFKDLSDKDLVKILEQGNFSQNELGELIKLMEKKGLNGSIMMVDDPNSEEGKTATEYIEYHKQLPESYMNLKPSEIAKFKKDLLGKNTNIVCKKKALIVFAHLGTLDAWEILKKFNETSEPNLRVWTKMALQECKMFLESNLTDRSKIDIQNIKDFK